ncbi:3-oxoacyl-ACP synthase [Aestuariicoccus sp. MJ-SS9]|uniref:3-oxoacyl-ACP synthase n=1 Tax=Aestuariicoccus sp. MJ-SS9 TaxID=3079855 RepID=UPI002912AE3D|nr:3-oxoacyl-ACP synthase [Aestuariicoccus sp. MJ-SS9]MDU8910054.1 3-oxoacyl-ACP synthase [Aestuariicoccus sp. MJ-SS9]
MPLPRAWTGTKRMAHLAAGAIYDLLRNAGGAAKDAALILLLAEEDRPGRPDIGAQQIVDALAEHAGFRPNGNVKVLTDDRAGGVVGLAEAAAAVRRNGKPVIVLGLDSYLIGRTIAHYMSERRLLTTKVSDGFIPGEAAAAVLITAGGAGVRLRGTGLGKEPAFLTNTAPDGLPALPFRCDGMTRAYFDALGAAGCRHDHVRLKLGDLIGEAYWFKQTALAMHRTQRERSPVQPIWALGASLGNIGAATVPALAGWTLAAQARGYAPAGPILIEASNDDGLCGAVVTEAA